MKLNTVHQAAAILYIGAAGVVLPASASAFLFPPRSASVSETAAFVVLVGLSAASSVGTLLSRRRLLAARLPLRGSNEFMGIDANDPMYVPLRRLFLMSAIVNVCAAIPVWLGVLYLALFGAWPPYRLFAFVAVSVLTWILAFPRVEDWRRVVEGHVSDPPGSSVTSASRDY